MGPIYRESCKCTPPGRVRAPPDTASPVFLGNWGDLDGGSGPLVVLVCVLRATIKKGRQLFRVRKVHPGENPGYAYDCY